jgi:hypothetical protein
MKDRGRQGRCATKRRSSKWVWAVGWAASVGVQRKVPRRRELVWTVTLKAKSNTGTQQCTLCKARPKRVFLARRPNTFQVDEDITTTTIGNRDV